MDGINRMDSRVGRKCCEMGSLVQRKHRIADNFRSRGVGEYEILDLVDPELRLELPPDIVGCNPQAQGPLPHEPVERGLLLVPRLSLLVRSPCSCYLPSRQNS